jgi:hypothetical protein
LLRRVHRAFCELVTRWWQSALGEPSLCSWQARSQSRSAAGALDVRRDSEATWVAILDLAGDLAPRHIQTVDRARRHRWSGSPRSGCWRFSRALATRSSGRMTCGCVRLECPGIHESPRVAGSSRPRVAKNELAHSLWGALGGVGSDAAGGSRCESMPCGWCWQRRCRCWWQRWRDQRRVADTHGCELALAAMAKAP